jgi:hypothetical protein
MEQIDSERVEMNWWSRYMAINGFAVKNWVSNGKMVGDGPGLHMENER